MQSFGEKRCACGGKQCKGWLDNRENLWTQQIKGIHVDKLKHILQQAP